MNRSELDKKCADALRVLAIDGVQKANSGHPGMPMGMADVAFVLWSQYLSGNPRDPEWPNRDRFILSAGHGSMLLYSLLYLSGYPLTLDDLKDFRQFGSKTPGHPEYDPEIGIETTTGPLGQGFANGVGMAIAEEHLAARFNRSGYPIFEHRVYAIVSDGEMMEGATHEAASLAGHLGLGNLIYLYDDNEISIEGSTDLAFTEDVAARFEAYGWHVQDVDGHDQAAVSQAIAVAQDAAGQPHLIVCHTHIAQGSPNLVGDAHAHGAPLGDDEVALTKQALDWPADRNFYVPDEVRDVYRGMIDRGTALQAAWEASLAGYRADYPDLAAELDRFLAGDLPCDWAGSLPTFSADDGPLATRAASGAVLNALASVVPELIGGSADLEPSTKTFLKGLPAFQKNTPEGRNLHFGVRELGMGGVLNGLATYPGLRVYGGTFLVFSDFMRPTVRLAALMGLPVTYVWTHDSIFVGEDGPTHEPVEQVMSLRLIPNLTVIRPADANETAAAWKVALTKRDGPVALALSRQKLSVITTADVAGVGVQRGGYVLSESAATEMNLILIATGSEVSLALEAQAALVKEGLGVRVVSLPSWELFEAQPTEYRESVLPRTVTKRLSVEAGVTNGWQRYVGLGGASIGVDRFGASAPYQSLAEAYGITVAHVVAEAKRLLAT